MTETCQITRSSWGRMEITVGKQPHTFKDCKIWPGGAREWNWSETGTTHDPGIQVEDVKEILQNGTEVVILGRGVFSRMGVCVEIEQFLIDKGIECHILDTVKAVNLFNQLVRQGRKVSGLFHSTC